MAKGMSVHPDKRKNSSLNHSLGICYICSDEKKNVRRLVNDLVCMLDGECRNSLEPISYSQ
ncbi:MAG: hypothetical protein AAFY70_12295, partial [Bacteroidota bacterium]